MAKEIGEKSLCEYDEYELPVQKAKDIISSPEENEDYFPCPYNYFFKDEKIDREVFFDLQTELKNPALLRKELKEQDKIEEELREDSSFYQDEWDFFLECISSYMDEKNEKGYWETPCTDARDDCVITDKGDGTGSRNMLCETGKELIDQVINFNKFQYQTGPIHVFDYKKTGLKITASSHDDIFVLPACRTGFIRDWDKDGICIEEQEEE